MAELSTVARPYAEALFSAARAKGAADAWLPLLEALARTVSEPQIALLTTDPRLSDQHRFELISAVAGAALPPELTAFLKLMIQNGRLAALPEVAAQFRRLKNDAEGTADCLIETAFALTDAQLGDLIQRLGRTFPRRLKAELRLAPQLIGGVRVTVGDRVLDGSVRARLDAMRVQLTA
ncbi:MAG TPA: F0F1 ATP synthase subunit delta [Burkholderiaceae bacterium]|nr:F0F1 ATP synthase subunit delta [Burkholderiaceae bacterium]